MRKVANASFKRMLVGHFELTFSNAGGDMTFPLFFPFLGLPNGLKLKLKPKTLISRGDIAGLSVEPSEISDVPGLP